MPLSLTHPYPLELELERTAWYELVARHLGYLPQPFLTKAPLAFKVPERPPWRLSPAGRHHSFYFKFDPVFINSDMYILTLLSLF